MPQMDAIEISKGQDRTLESSLQFLNASKDLQVLPSFVRLIRVRILSHYFVARFLGLFMTVLVAGLVIMATIELVLHFDELPALGTSAFDAEAAASIGIFRALWLRLASYYLTDLLPLASFIAVFVTFAWSGRSLELLAVQAGGVRLRRVVLPVLTTALILSLGTAVLHETLILRAKTTWSSQSQEAHDQPDFGRKAFWYHRGSTITNIRSADESSGTLFGVEIFERGPEGGIVRVVRVDRVQILSDGVWRLENADIWTFDPADPAAHPQVEENVSLDLDLDAIDGRVLLGADPVNLSLTALAEYLDADPQETSSNLRRLKSLYHTRLSEPWLVLVFAWLALPFALRVDRRGLLGGPAAAAITALSIFFLIKSAGMTLSQREFIPVGVTPWLAIGCVVIGSSIALRGRSL